MAGTLSVGCPQYFKSGQTEFKESGWWTLQEKVPPSVKLADVGRAEGRLRRSGGSKKYNRKRQSCKLNTNDHEKPGAEEVVIPRNTYMKA